MSLYGDRWQYHPPWSVTSPWKPRVLSGGDEFCNGSIEIIVPLAGSLVIFHKRRPMRDVMSTDYPCFWCQTELWTANPDADPARWLLVETCDACQRDWYLPRDAEGRLCEHLIPVTGTADPRLAYHVSSGGHRSRNCKCQREDWFTEDEVMMALAARKEREND